MGIEDGFAHYLILAGAFLYGACLVESRNPHIARAIGFLAGAIFVVVGVADRVANHL